MRNAGDLGCTRVAVTGHRVLADEEATAACVYAALDRLSNECGSLEVITLMADGADILAAEQALAIGARVLAILPQDAKECREQIRTQWLDRFDTALSRCAEVIEPLERLPKPECYRAAGVRMLERADVLLAIWNGKRAHGIGGTGNIVELAIGMGIPVVRVVDRGDV